MNNYIGHSSLELWECSKPPGTAEETNPGNELEINVIFTDHRSTLSALKTAGTLAHQLRAHINLLVPRVVPYALPLASPAVSIQFTERRLLDFARQVAQDPMAISVQLYLCRDRRLCLLQAPKAAISSGRRRQGAVVASEGNQIDKDASVCWTPRHFYRSRVRNDGSAAAPQLDDCFPGGNCSQDSSQPILS